MKLSYHIASIYLFITNNTLKVHGTTIKKEKKHMYVNKMKKDK